MDSRGRIKLPPELFQASHPNNPDPLERYAALMLLWTYSPTDVGCRDLLVPGGKNSLTTPTVTEWKIVIEHKCKWEQRIVDLNANG